MQTPSHHEKRIKPRISVTLKASVSFAGHAPGEHQALISNLSVTGARVHIEHAALLRMGMAIAMKIFIPDTILHCLAEGTVLWVRRQHDAVSLGVRFAEPLSEFMLQRLVEK